MRCCAGFFMGIVSLRFERPAHPISRYIWLRMGSKRNTAGRFEQSRPIGSCAVDKVAQEPLFNGPTLLRDGADSLFDHVDHDVRVSDRDGVRRVQLNDVGVGAVGFEPEFFLGDDGIE